MNSASQVSLFRRDSRSKLAANPFLVVQKITLLDVLTFISKAPHTSLRAVKIALQCRRRDVLYTVTFKNGRRENWAVDSPDHMIDILIKERRGILHVTKGKEAIS